MGNPAWVITKVILRKDYTLLLMFEDGKHGVYDVFRQQKWIGSPKIMDNVSA